VTTLRTFVSYNLRTTDMEAAQAFYTALFGWQLRQSGASRAFFAGEQRVGELVPLPERARAQGAPAHWLGHIGVEDVEATAQRLVTLGGQPLGPVQQRGDGVRVAALKDAQGAVFALSSEPSHGPSRVVAWHELNTTDREQAARSYAELFGWRTTESADLGPVLGGYQMFTWHAAGRSVGGMVDSARLPGVHTHWLFYFPVEDVDAAVARVRALGGSVGNGPMTVPGGDRVAQCEDPQGAAFALRQSVGGH
jgi:uncharacterized protein